MQKCLFPERNPNPHSGPSARERAVTGGWRRQRENSSCIKRLTSAFSFAWFTFFWKETSLQSFQTCFCAFMNFHISRINQKPDYNLN